MNPLVLVRPEPRRAERGDDALVAAVRAGDDRAFEELYERYHRRIAAHVRGMVRDHGRAEDVTQEVFLSALRRMRQTDRPIAFRPWVYEIARNACIDHYRRTSRTEEVPIDGAGSGGSENQFGLTASTAGPDQAVAHKQELDLLRGAFGGLSSSHHEILVLRELEGLSYREIGDRMGLSRPAVESTLFRARRRLFQEYAELESGRRCRRMQSILVESESDEGLELGGRERRRLTRHLAWCSPCRRHAYHAGLTPDLGLTRVRDRVAVWIPWPLLLVLRTTRPRAGSQGVGSGSPLSVEVAHVAPGLAEVLAGPALRLAAAGALAVGSVAAGIGAQPSHHALGTSRAALGVPPGAVATAGSVDRSAVAGSPSGPLGVAAASGTPSSTGGSLDPGPRSSSAVVGVARRPRLGPAAGVHPAAGGGRHPSVGRPGASGASGLPPVSLPPVPVQVPATAPAAGVGPGSAPSTPSQPDTPAPSGSPAATAPAVRAPSVPTPPVSNAGSGDPTNGAAGAVAPGAGAVLGH